MNVSPPFHLHDIQLSIYDKWRINLKTEAQDPGPSTYQID